jgi:hypothetical protein
MLVVIKLSNKEGKYGQVHYIRQPDRYVWHVVLTCWFIEGRDKLCKVIQYGSRIIKYNQSTKNKELAAKFQGLMGKWRSLEAPTHLSI